MSEQEARIGIKANVRWVSETQMTAPASFHTQVICNDDCETCPLNGPEGCAMKCVRFPTDVCAGCPCRASNFCGKINE